MIKLLMVHLLLLLPLFLSAQEVDLLMLNNEYNKALQLIDEKLSADEAQSKINLSESSVNNDSEANDTRSVNDGAAQ